MRRRCVAALCVTALVVLAACSDDTSPASSVESPAADSTTAGEDIATLPIIDQIDAAVAALEAQLGGPQEYFEINATARLVNLFVALNDGAVAQPWLYLAGSLTSAEGQPASGGTFAAASLTFDPAVVLSKVQLELPDLTIESFYIHGDGQGSVLYGVLATSSKGGGLDVVLGADGTVKSVDPVN
ncbi:MAG TPA: hypothetical protein PLT40_18245 [Ilumatobacteraceae bacterium]|nr:hypothetical protein [Ilumatobacteraceae bacterium]